MSPAPISTPSLRDLEHHAAFIERHIGPNDAEVAQMLRVVGHDSLDAMTDAIVPASIKSPAPLALPKAITEVEALAKIRAIADRNQVYRSFIGQGYYGTHTPNVILRNILENPAWYTAYTPYQAEISQGRMEALINFQTLCRRPHRHGHRQRVAARRGHGRRRGDDAGQALGEVEVERVLRLQRRTPADAGSAAHPRRWPRHRTARRRRRRRGQHRLLRRAAAIPRHLRPHQRLRGAGRRGARARRPGRRRHRPARADPDRRRPANGAPTSSSATPSASACRSASAARTPRSWPAATPTSARCPAA